MRSLVWEALLLATAAVVSWWLLFAPHAPHAAPPLAAPSPPPPDLALSVALLPRTEPTPAPVREVAPTPPPDNAPPPSEVGTPEGSEDAPPAVVESEPHESPAPAPDPTDDPQLLATARAELAGESSLGFATTLVASPEEQLAIARAFGEELVLVPRSALDPAAEHPVWYRLALDGEARVERVSGRPPLERHRQYRDLFEYEYGRLPAPLRELRRSVLSRGEVVLFGALIPPREWAVFILRRREALRAAGRSADEVRRFVLRYASQPDGGYDLVVDEIVFADGERFRPSARPRAKGV